MIKREFTTPLWALLCSFFTSLAARAQEEAVDLGAMDARPSWNPYSFTREPYLMVVPVIGMIIVCVHLLRRERRKKPRQKKTAENYFND